MAIVQSADQKAELKVEDETKKKSAPVKSVKKKTGKPNSEKSVIEMKNELQKLMLDVKSGSESNTSLIRKLRKDIARKITKEHFEAHNH